MSDNDTLVVKRRKYLYLAAVAPTVEEEENKTKRKQDPFQRRTTRKVWVSEWLTRRHIRSLRCVIV